MQAGPKVSSGFDVALTEILAAGSHYFVVAIGSERGAEVLSVVPHRTALAAEIEQAEEISQRTAEHMGRSLDTVEIKELLYRNLEHPRWQEVATRCLACANCTMVCPTCFCTTVEDVTDLTGMPNAGASGIRVYRQLFLHPWRQCATSTAHGIGTG
jgi:ferredoxin